MVFNVYQEHKGAFTYDVSSRGGFEMLTVADKGGRGISLADVSKKCFKSSVPITMRETTALIYSPKLMTTFSFKLDKINI